ncbi:MAG TPA: PAS domain S-box protein [Burkholderiales bacterium]|jgi:PAS domain S-box-containing protein|nr:PAS domain S-box protein [Burkholderiales bacterium]
MDKLQILVLEDVEDDAKLITRALRDGGLEFSAQRVETREDFLQALEEQRPDVILADYKLPHFDGRSALKLASERLPRAPVIVVTGTMVDEDAVEMLREGAADYILKDRLSRLAAAVRRALEDARLKSERLAADRKYRALFDLSRDGIVLLDFESGRVVDCNPAFEAQAGYGLELLKQQPIWELQGRDGIAAVRAKFEEVKNDVAAGDDRFELHRPDGTTLPVEFRARVIELDGKRVLQAHLRDISERVKAEALLHEQIDELRRFQRVTVDRELRLQELENRLKMVAALA